MIDEATIILRALADRDRLYAVAQTPAHDNARNAIVHLRQDVEDFTRARRTARGQLNSIASVRCNPIEAVYNSMIETVIKFYDECIAAASDYEDEIKITAGRNGAAIMLTARRRKSGRPAAIGRLTMTPDVIYNAICAEIDWVCQVRKSFDRSADNAAQKFAMNAGADPYTARTHAAAADYNYRCVAAADEATAALDRLLTQF